MYRIALNTAITWVRKTEVRCRFDAPLYDSHEASPPPELSEEATILRHLIDGLDQMNRALLLLYMEELSHDEIGDILGLSPGNVATRISRIKQQLRRQVNLEEKH
jgi:RNA polymerase sigma factor (sigma-70 family)